MKNLFTYLKALWSRVSGLESRQVGVILEEAAIEHPFSTHSAPFGTCWQPSGKLHSVVRCAAMLVMLFTIGIGNVWGAVTSPITLSTTSSTVGNGTPVTDKFDYKLTFTSVTGSGSNYVQNAKSASIYNTVAIPGAITSIKLTNCATTSSKTDGGFTIYGGTSEADCTHSVGSVTGLSNSAADKTITFNSSDNYTFFKITNGSARVLKISSIVISFSAAASYTITYNSNGGSGSMTSTTGATVNAATCTFTAPTGKVFDHWNTASNNSGTSYNAGASVNATVTLYAIWRDIQYTLKVSNGNGGYTTYNNKVKSDLTKATAEGGNSCAGGLDGTYSGWRVGALETPAASPGTTYNSSTVGAMPSDGSTLYAVFRQTSGSYYYLTNPSCAAVKTLSSIAITTAPTTTKYLVGETFSKTGAVVTATYSDATTANVTASASWTPTTGLVAGGNTITASYTEGGVTKTATTTVTAYSVTVQKKDEDGTTIADAGVTASASGRTLTASVGSTHYVFKTWKYGTASGTSIASATSASTSLTGTPSAAVTVIAEFYKPCTVTWSVNGSTYQTTSNVSYNTTTSTPANPSVPGECTGSTFMGWTSNSSWASDSAPGDLFNGTSPTITGNITFYAVFADEK